jgi:hypothetical protein
MGGNPPFGYRALNRMLVVVAEHAHLVRRVFDRFIETGSGTLIANELAVQGALTPKGNPVDRKFISNSQIEARSEFRVCSARIMSKTPMSPHRFQRF